MAITIVLSEQLTPQNLIQKINDLIVQNTIRTCSVDGDGDYTHSPSEWRNHAWIRPYPQPDNSIIFGLIGNKNEIMTKTTYAVYHGRFAEMLLAHFDDIIISLSISPLQEKQDSF